MKKERQKKPWRKRVPEYLSKTHVIVCICIAVIVLGMLLWNFVVQLGAGLFVNLKLQDFSSIHIPNPLYFDFARYPWWYLAGVVLLLLLSLRLAYLLRLNYAPIEEEQPKGSQQWATEAEVKGRLRGVPEKDAFYPGKPGFPLSRIGRKLYIDTSPVNNLIAGAPRSGKGEIFLFGAIDVYSRAKEMMDRASMVLSDPKGELAAASKQPLERRGYQVYVMDLKDMAGMSYNPLTLVMQAYLANDTAKAQLLANTLSYTLFHAPAAKEPQWENWNVALSNALILAIVIDCCEQARLSANKGYWYSKINLTSVARLLLDHCTPNADGIYPIDLFFAARPDGDIAKLQYTAVGAAGSRQKGNIFSNALSVLTKFTIEPVARMTSQNSMELKSVGFGDQPVAVFLVTPDYDRSKDYLVSMFISQLYFVLSEAASHSPRGQCRREVVFLLDEFGNIPPVPDMANMLTVCPGRNIRFTLVVQAYSQIYKLYGQEDGRTIISGCTNQIYLLTVEPESAKLFSSMLGSESISVTSRCGEPLKIDKHITSHVEGRPLMNPNELMELQPGECIVVSARHNPIFNRGKTRMKYRYEYLGKTFDNTGSIDDLHLADMCLHKDVDLDSIVYTPVIPSVVESLEPPVYMGKQVEKQLSPSGLQKLTALLENVGVQDARLRALHAMTVMEIDAFSQSLMDEGRIKESLYEDIANLLEKEGVWNIETA